MNRVSNPTPGWAIIGMAVALFFGIGHMLFIEPAPGPSGGGPQPVAEQEKPAGEQAASNAAALTMPAYFSDSGEFVSTGFSPTAR